ncbi:hypothetical protein [Desulfobacula sp.]|uniref:hypothetical protein n=1 Tax=Desulfobacula sp. TaxID=2593537 RepID=UPI0026396767|nr:hypothetical protein [Desulfobacula sp.]
MARFIRLYSFGSNFVAFIVRVFVDVLYSKTEDEAAKKNKIIRQQAKIQKYRDRLVIEAKLEKKYWETGSINLFFDA